MVPLFVLSLVATVPHLTTSVQIATTATEPKFDTGTVHVLLGRAVFDFQDHVKRVEAIRETWGSAPDIRLHVLDFGKELFDLGFKDWCKGCPTVAYSTASDEMVIPDDMRKSDLYNVDGHIWAMNKSLEDPSCQWVLLGQDMLSLHVANTRAYLSRFDPSKSYAIGNRLHGYGPPPRVGEQSIMASPWGFFISRGAAKKLVDQWNDGRHMMMIDPNLRVHGGATDFGLARVLQKFGAQYVDTRDAQGRDRMFLWPPSRIQQGSWWDDWYPGYRIDEPKKELSPEAFLFFFAPAEEIRQLGAFFTGNSSSARPSFYQEKTWKMLEPLRSA